ncbi:UDP binding domain-containing protein [Candidatus Pelagibacter sp. Uisw_114]
MQKFVLKKIEEKIISIQQKKIDPKVLICGLTYKKDVSDVRNSLSLKIFINLRKKYKKIIGYDYVCEDKISSKI